METLIDRISKNSNAGLPIFGKPAHGVGTDLVARNKALHQRCQRPGTERPRPLVFVCVRGAG